MTFDPIIVCGLLIYIGLKNSPTAGCGLEELLGPQHFLAAETILTYNSSG